VRIVGAPAPGSARQVLDLYKFKDYIRDMSRPNVHEVRENLAEYLAAAERGEEVLICRRNQPVARLVAIEREPVRKPRLIGKAADAGQPLPAAFFDPLPAELLAAFGGGAADPPAAAPRSVGRRPRA
jgi:prevent-host-death family protein